MNTNAGKTYQSLVVNAAARDKFTAPDSSASRPNPGSLEDRPRSPFQTTLHPAGNIADELGSE